MNGVFALFNVNDMRVLSFSLDRKFNSIISLSSGMLSESRTEYVTILVEYVKKRQNRIIIIEIIYAFIRLSEVSFISASPWTR